MSVDTGRRWAQLTIDCSSAATDAVTEALGRVGCGGAAIEDKSDIEHAQRGGESWDFIDEALFDDLPEQARVRGYLPDDERLWQRVDSLRLHLDAVRALGGDAFQTGSLKLGVSFMDEEDWSQSWKKYYKPFKAGSRILVCPHWEEAEPAPGEILLRLNPGMAFGNGTHETTAMCVSLLEEVLRPGMRVLDVGCGSGILGVAALLLGAERVLAVDIDPLSVKVAQENAYLNGVAARLDARVGDLLRGIDFKADLIVANIVADVIIRLAPAALCALKDGGTLIASGIIRSRRGDVEAALTAAGYGIERAEYRGEWVALAARRRG